MSNLTRNYTSALAFGLFLFLSPGTHADTNLAPQRVYTSEANCDSVVLPHRPLMYCFRDAANQAHNDHKQISIIYFFHGLGGGPQDFFSDAWHQVVSGLTVIYGDRMPILVGISLGSQGVFNDETSDIVKFGIPQLESRIAPGKEIRRILVGGSLGGHNALRLLGEAPDQFAAAAVVCPAIGTINAYHQDEVDAYINRHRDYMDVNFFTRALGIFKSQIPTAEDWDANNPFTFLDKGAYDHHPIYMSVGVEDTLGFIEGSREFKRRADLRSEPHVDFHEVHGPHCVFDIGAFFSFMNKVVP